jgi:hypothetical protein
VEILTREEVAAAIIAIDDPDEQAQAAALALELYGESPQTSKFLPYRFDPVKYINTFLGWHPWSCEEPDKPGQKQIIDAYTLALRQQFEKRDYEFGRS